MKKLIPIVTLFAFCLGMVAYADLGDITLRPGMTHPDITELQQKLDMLGYFDYHKYTDYYGDITEAAVRKFQEDNGLKVDGIAGSQTINYIETRIRQIQYIKEKEEEEEKNTNLISSRAFVDFTRSFLGKPYVYGASSGQAFDCSGLTTYIMKNYGINLDRTASQQFKKGTPVAKEDLKPGDLVFFSSNGKNIGHVGIYIGNDKFIHASSVKKKVVISDLSTYTEKYQGARRYIELDHKESYEGENKE
ncbi:MAG TPA: glycoside hydrolase [Clostridiales bacterium]|nr:glycoside hydrolase [Clostridiales bacterium]